MATKNPRKAKLDAIKKKIAMFIMAETYTDESEAQNLLADACTIIDQAADLLVKNDEQNQKEAQP